MRSKDRGYFQSITFALIIITISTLFLIGYLQYHVTNLEIRNNKYALKLLPNGTELFQPSPTPTPMPKYIAPGRYSNGELGITLILPDNSKGHETIEPNDWLKLKIESLTNKNLVMNISRSKRVFGYGGKGTFSCKDVLINGIPLIILEQKVSRCKFTENNIASYDIRLYYINSEDSLAIRIYYDFKQHPSPKEFEFFDRILATLEITK